MSGARQASQRPEQGRLRSKQRRKVPWGIRQSSLFTAPPFRLSAAQTVLPLRRFRADRPFEGRAKVRAVVQAAPEQRQQRLPSRNPGVCGKNKSSGGGGGLLGRKAFGAPNQGLESSFC